MPGKHAKNSLARALLAFFVRETEHISFASLAKILGRDPSTLTQLASRFEIKAISNTTAAKNVEDMRRWLENSLNTKSQRNKYPNTKPEKAPIKIGIEL
jgi:hypothetical protein